MWLPHTAVAVDHFHLITLANQARPKPGGTSPSRSRAAATGPSTRPGPTACSCCAAAITSAAGHPSGCKRCSPRTTLPAPLVKSTPHPTGTPPADPSNRLRSSCREPRTACELPEGCIERLSMQPSGCAAACHRGSKRCPSALDGINARMKTTKPPTKGTSPRNANGPARFASCRRRQSSDS
jgi:hypothetical protein